MPIIDEYGSRQLHFGKGDISVGGGLLAMYEAVGVVTFKQQEPREVGSRSEHGPGHSLEPNETPVRMTFDNVESINVVIRQLEVVKRMMIVKIESGRDVCSKCGLVELPVNSPFHRCQECRSR
ncbi:hypothetical protein [Brevibacillus sp. SIMBA_040]|uniref:hypothetical protein n=1 Tax=unclassified Brevibacillus TaxID=2684853 RepID=UPI00397DE37B